MRHHCIHCGQIFRADKRHNQQKYCKKAECQRARRNRWQREKREEDADYRANQKKSQRRWMDDNSGYWRDYRKSHQSYTQHNREGQRRRRAKTAVSSSSTGGIRVGVAKMDAKSIQPTIKPGTYRIVAADAERVAKMDLVILQHVEIELVS